MTIDAVSATRLLTMQVPLRALWGRRSSVRGESMPPKGSARKKVTDEIVASQDVRHR